jgi:hypothetical protein
MMTSSPYLLYVVVIQMLEIFEFLKIQRLWFKDEFANARVKSELLEGFSSFFVDRNAQFSSSRVVNGIWVCCILECLCAS